MQRVYVLFLVLVILLAACGAPAPIVITATPDDPTPTQEVVPDTPIPPTPVPEWSTDCVPAGIFPLNPNPCPENYAVTHLSANTTQVYPEGTVVVERLITNGYTQIVDVLYQNNALSVQMFGLGGRVGFQTHGLQLFAGNCYTINMPAYANFSGTDFTKGSEALRAYSIIYMDNGSFFDLKFHSVVSGSGAARSLSGDRPDVFWWSFRPSRDTTIVWEVGIESLWAAAVMGNSFDIRAIYVQEQDNTNLCG